MTLRLWLALACGYVACAVYVVALLREPIDTRRGRVVTLAMAALWPIVLALVLAWIAYDVLTGTTDDLGDNDRPTPDSAEDVR